jgi:nicotinamide-nucleotide amidase
LSFRVLSKPDLAKPIACVAASGADGTALLQDTDMTPIADQVEALAAALRARGQMMATAESCTGGLIAGACTEISGSSDWFERGFVTYSNAAKSDLLGVPPALIHEHGAVSEPVARAMAAGAVAHAHAQWSVAVTGVAGPTGGSAEKPVGTVWFGWATPQGVFTECRRFDGDRAAVRRAAVAHALSGLLQRL